MVAYFLVAKLGLHLATLNGSVSPVWPATGFSFAVVYLFGNRFLLAIWLGAFCANAATDVPLAAAFAISIGNMLEAWVGVVLIRGICSLHDRLEYQTETIAFGVASICASLVSASIGVLALYLSGSLKNEMVSAVWVTWWVGDTLGGLVVAPFLIRLRVFKINKDTVWNILSVFALGLMLLYFVLIVPVGGSFVFLIFPLVLYAAYRLGSNWALFVSVLICVAFVTATVNGLGPFFLGSLNERLVHLQLFLGSVILTGLALSGFKSEDLTKASMAVLILCWILGGSVFYSFEQSERRATEAHFKNLVEEVQTSIESTMSAYEDALQAGVGLFAASKDVDRFEWQAYTESLGLIGRHPGMHGLGVILPVEARERRRYESDIRKQGLSEFSLKAVPGFETELHRTDRPHYVVTFIEPFLTNYTASGLDIGTEPSRRFAAEIARDTGATSLTSKLTLVQANENIPGFLIYKPIYKKRSKLESVEDRRAAHLGWIYGPVIYHNFFSEVFSKTNSEVEVRVFEGDSGAESGAVFSNFSDNTRSYKIVTKARLGQRDFLLQWRKSPSFVSSHDTIVSWVGFCGAVTAILLANVMIGLQTVGRRSRNLAKDLTKELKASREKFKAGERRLQYALDGSNDGIWDWNINKGEMYVSGKIAENHGWPQLFYAKSVEDLRIYAHPDDLEQIGRSVQRTLSGEQLIHEVETRYRTVKGEWCWVLTRGKVSERDHQGRPIRMTGVHIDIDALKKTQSLLQNTQYQLRNIANSVPSLVSLWNTDLVCQFANDAFAQWFGLTSEKLTGVDMKSVLSIERFKMNQGLFDRVIKGESIQIEYEVQREHDGEMRHVIANYLPNRSKGLIEGFFLFVQDITDLKRAELSAIEERKTAEDATRVKSQFLANMSHEIRTPMNGIIGMTNLLLNSIKDPEARERLSIIQNCGESLLNLVNEILDYSKLEVDKVELEKLPFSPKEAVKEIVELFAPRASDKGLFLTYQDSESVPRWILGDANRFKQILSNLVANAIKFTESGGIKISSAFRPSENNYGRLEFAIEDTGIGLSEESISKLFHPFSQADISTTRRFGGTGLGLAICKGLCEKMDGSIRIKSKLGLGSAFIFDIKVEECSPQEQLPKNTAQILMDPEMEKKHPLRILVAEDNQVNQLVVRGILEKLGYRPDIVSSGREAVERVKAQAYDIVIMDCHMPEMDGFVATQKIIDHFKMKSRPRIIALTASTMKEDVERCFDSGMDDFLAKPISIAALIRVLYECRSSLNMRAS